MRHLTSTLALTLFLAGVAAAATQDRKTGKDEGKSTPRLRGQLPPNYRQLGLSDEQRQRIYKIQDEYAQKIEELERQVEKMKVERNGAYLKVLTKAQKDRLDEIRKGAAGGQ